MDRFILGRSSPSTKPQLWLAFSLLFAFFTGLLLLCVPELGRLGFLSPISLPTERLQKWFFIENKIFSKNVSLCPGTVPSSDYRAIYILILRQDTLCRPFRKLKLALSLGSVLQARRVMRSAWMWKTLRSKLTMSRTQGRAIVHGRIVYEITYPLDCT